MPGECEDLLDHDGAAQEIAGVEARHRDDGEDGVLEGVAHDHDALGRPLALAVRM